MILFAKSKLNKIEFLISKSLIDSVINHDDIILINNVLKEYNECLKNTESKNPEVPRTKKGRIMLLSKYSVSDSKKSEFIKQQEATRL